MTPINRNNFDIKKFAKNIKSKKSNVNHSIRNNRTRLSLYTKFRTATKSYRKFQNIVDRDKETKFLNDFLRHGGGVGCGSFHRWGFGVSTSIRTPGASTLGISEPRSLINKRLSSVGTRRVITS